ncbi:hypothetical protein RB195_023017 [Necator americanus]|uniref:Uncharacterized protein n=1 Tax=Necator americanus TaxID=51031 RepID=A0ABR1EHH0_NECAM
MMSHVTSELNRRKRAACGACKSIEAVVKNTRNIRLGASPFNTTVFPHLTYASEIWAFRRQENNAISVTERQIERVGLGVSDFTLLKGGEGTRSSRIEESSICELLVPYITIRRS